MKANTEESVLGEVVGEDILLLVDALKGKKNFSEFKLAEKIDKDLNTTRSMLYRLLEADLISFTKKKDKKRGWYIYYWTLKLKRIKSLLIGQKKKRLNTLKSMLERETSTNFFICENRCARLDFEQAFGFNFKCPECGKMMNYEENRGRIVKIEKEIESLEKEIGEE